MISSIPKQTHSRARMFASLNEIALLRDEAIVRWHSVRFRQRLGSDPTPYQKDKSLIVAMAKSRLALVRAERGRGLATLP